MSETASDRMISCQKFVESLTKTYPNATQLHVNIKFEWKEPVDEYGAALCPVISIEVIK